MKENLIKDLERQIEGSINEDEPKDKKGWHPAIGVLLTRTEAELFVELLKRERKKYNFITVKIEDNNQEEQK